jgi:hypothetical protein
VALAGWGCADSCDDLHDRTFESREILPCGMDSCRWTVAFHSGRYGWSHDEAEESGSFTCDGAAVTAAPDAGGAALSGRFDSATDLLEWEGRSYQPVAP